MDLGLGTFLGGLVGGISNLFTQGSQIKVAREYNAAQRELAEYQNEWNMDMWNKQNEYNSPVQQMKRYQQAGLNPHLIYGQGSNGNSQSVPKAASYDIAQVPRFDAGSAFSNALNSALQMANVELVNANKEKVKEDSELSKTQRLKLQSDIIWQNIQNYIAERTKGFKISREEYDTDNAKWTSQGAKWDMRSKRFNFTTLLPTQYRSMLAGIDKINQEIATSKSQEDLNVANKDYIIGKGDREERNLEAQLEVYDATIKNLNAQTQKAYNEAIGQGLLNAFNKHLLTPERAQFLNQQENLRNQKLAEDVRDAIVNRRYTKLKMLIDQVKGYYASLTGAGELPDNVLSETYIMALVATTLKEVNKHFVETSNEIINE